MKMIKTEKEIKLTLPLTLLLLIAAFLVGSLWAKSRSSGSVGEKVKITEEKKAQEDKNSVLPAQTSEQPSFTPLKSAKPKIEFFVMSFCPYGNQAEDGLEPVYQLLKSKVEWQPRYIVSDKKAACEQSCPFRVYNQAAEDQCKKAVESKQVADMETCKGYYPFKTAEECLQKECANIKAGEWDSLHGSQELNQDVREICAFKEGDLDKWWKFVALVNKNCNSNNADTCWQTYASQAGFDTGKIANCAIQQTNSLLGEEVKESTEKKASGSPTVLINGVLYSGGRSPEDYKKALCGSFENPPEDCQKVLGQESAPASGGCN